MPAAARPLDGRVALVAGASRGIGAAASVALAEAGAHCVLVARTVGALEALDNRVKAVGGDATLVPLDLCDGAGVDRLGAALHERFGRLDALLGNAAMLGALTPATHTEPATFEQTLATNVTANFRLIRSMEPLLRASDAGRAVFLTSGVARRVVPFWSAYAASKAALEMLVLTWAAEIAGGSLRVNLYNPGPTRTAMRAGAFPGEDPQSLPPPERHGPALVRLLSPACTMHGQWVAGDLDAPATVN
ncbi:MAG: SDR family NAD(P)-dependent oxidoreductase [Alphaproteobacteria bacterium]|nr:SDR family NAD(P)-dependent oxidoreductase [Alphaproteobacteria bacterium]